MIPVEIIAGMGEGRIKENVDRANSSMTYSIYYKNFCKCHNIPQHSTVKKKEQSEV
jgi:hypothetical protein